MVRRIVRIADEGIGHSLSGIVFPGCAVLVVPLLAVTALELPAAAVDRIAAPAGNTPGHDDDSPGNSGNAPGHNRSHQSS